MTSLAEVVDTGERADVTSHHIEGFDPGVCPIGAAPTLYSHIEGNLVMGGCPRVYAPEWAKYIVCLYPWEPYARHDHQVYLEAKLYDSAGMPDVANLAMIASAVLAFTHLGPTPVHCQAGWNRSGLVSALALMMAGRTADEAISLLRAKRCDQVLCNKTFEIWLRNVAIEELA